MELYLLVYINTCLTFCDYEEFYNRAYVVWLFY
jgi:hypothetical protein